MDASSLVTALALSSIHHLLTLKVINEDEEGEDACGQALEAVVSG